MAVPLLSAGKLSLINENVRGFKEDEKIPCSILAATSTGKLKVDAVANYVIDISATVRMRNFFLSYFPIIYPEYKPQILYGMVKSAPTSIP